MVRPKRCSRCWATISPRSICSVSFFEPTTTGFCEAPQDASRTADTRGHNSAAPVTRGMASIPQDIAIPAGNAASAILKFFSLATMSFQIRPLKEFLVKPALPPALSRLPELGLNLMWSWHHAQRAVFRRLEPAIWKASNHNPVVMLGRVPQETLERAARDPRYLALYRRACESLDAYMAAQNTASDMLVAYFSMEYGLLACMPIYSGGLGVLSGDHLKASSDAILPLVGLGLLYQRGYFRQSLDPDGWQQERTPVNDFYSLPITPVMRADGSEMIVDVLAGETTVFLKVWRIDVGRVKLYLLDSNIPQNPNPAHRTITAQLYGGDLHNRMRQEIVLG